MSKAITVSRGFVLKQSNIYYMKSDDEGGFLLKEVKQTMTMMMMMCKLITAGYRRLVLALCCMCSDGMLRMMK